MGKKQIKTAGPTKTKSTSKEITRQVRLIHTADEVLDALAGLTKLEAFDVLRIVHVVLGLE
jgi:hypothetical protein